MKVLATGPLVGCAGADPESSLPGGSGGTEGSQAGGGAGGTGTGGHPATSGGSAQAGSPFTSGGSAEGGSPFASGSNGPGGFSFAGTTSSGGTTVGTAGAGGSASLLTPAGNVSAVPLGSLVIAAKIFFLGRDAQGIYAMSMQCTHKGCAVVFLGNQLDCPCHHSRFDFNGNVLQGPATTPLPHLAVFVDGAGNISVDRYTVVSSSARTPV